jgi:hypothetical protein
MSGADAAAVFNRKYDEMYSNANAFYKTFGGEDTHPLWLGPEMPHYFFVFILQYCTLVTVLKATTGRSWDTLDSCD